MKVFTYMCEGCSLIRGVALDKGEVWSEWCEACSEYQFQNRVCIGLEENKDGVNT